MSLKRKIRGFYISCQLELFPRVERNYGMLSGTLKKLLLVFESVNVEDHLPPPVEFQGRPAAGPPSYACTRVFGEDGVEYSNDLWATGASSYG